MEKEQTPLFTAEGVLGFFPELIESFFSPQENEVKELQPVVDFYDDNHNGFFLNGGFPVT